MFSRCNDERRTGGVVTPCTPSTGIGEGEFTSEASLRHMLDDAVVSATLHDADAGAEAPPFGLMLLYPTPLVRSAGRPLMAGQRTTLTVACRFPETKRHV